MWTGDIDAAVGVCIFHCLEQERCLGVTEFSKLVDLLLTLKLTVKRLWRLIFILFQKEIDGNKLFNGPSIKNKEKRTVNIINEM
jgi:hypothetical protein